ncbi:hypothetical protein [Plantactinospora sp. CA-290183]|uniref:hypothetical protein n=1 Tax=Plantactinospora sp. CA-290183 TaxID=3240006 RepID=UPI003D8C2934
MQLHRRTLLSAAAATLASMTVPLAGPAAAGADPGPEPPVEPGEPIFPRPGGGTRAIHTLNVDARAYLLDIRTGAYHRLPFLAVTLAPDDRTVAVEDVEGRIGVARRAALLRDGAAAVRWTTLPPGAVLWSPDGTALLTTTPDRETRRVTANRYDLATGRLRQTLVDFDSEGAVGWAADSIRYVVRLPGPDPEVPDGPLRYVDPDGTPGALLGTTGHIWDAHAYSPTRRHVIVEPARGYPFPPEPAPWQLPRILDLRTGTVVAAVPTDWPLLGWHDHRRVVRVAPPAEGLRTVLEVVDVHTGTVTRRVPAPGLPPYHLQLGSAAHLHGRAAALGF